MSYIMNKDSKMGKLAHLLFCESSYLDIQLSHFCEQAGITEAQIDKAISSLEALQEYHDQHAQYLMEDYEEELDSKAKIKAKIKAEIEAEYYTLSGSTPEKEAEAEEQLRKEYRDYLHGK